jgi:hypothetical protein
MKASVLIRSFHHSILRRGCGHSHSSSRSYTLSQRHLNFTHSFIPILAPISRWKSTQIAGGGSASTPAPGLSRTPVSGLSNPLKAMDELFRGQRAPSAYRLSQFLNLHSAGLSTSHLTHLLQAAAKGRVTLSDAVIE